MVRRIGSDVTVYSANRSSPESTVSLQTHVRIVGEGQHAQHAEHAVSWLVMECVTWIADGTLKRSELVRQRSLPLAPRWHTQGSGHVEGRAS